MRKESTRSPSESRAHWEDLEEWVRGQIQGLIQELLEEEITELLGRAKSAPRLNPGRRPGLPEWVRQAAEADAELWDDPGVRRPRVRNVEERFERRVLPLFARKSKKVADLIPELYLHGLAEGDFDLALRGLLGDEARVSASTVARLKEKWHAELAEWRQRPLDDLEVVYMWVDGVYKAGLEKEKAAILVVRAALSDGSKVVVSAMPGYRESTESWSEVLRGLKERGLECPRLVIGDGHLGIWGALRNVYREAAEQRCWNHKILNVLDKLPKREHAQAKLLLCRIPYSQSRKEAERLRSIFSTWCHERAHQAASEALERDWGANGHLLPLSQGALAASTYDEPGGVALRRPETSDRCRQTLQEGGPGDCSDLEDADDRRKTLPSPQGTRAHEKRLSRHTVYGWHDHRGYR